MAQEVALRPAGTLSRGDFVDETIISPDQYLRNLQTIFSSVEVTDAEGEAVSLDQAAREVHSLLTLRKNNGHKVMVIGNGGSAAIAAHMQNDLSSAADIRALSFQDIPLLTAATNDFGYELAYERFVLHWADDNDLLFAISSSGESENILRAVQAARKNGCLVVTLSGFKENNRLRRRGDINFYVPVADYGYVETLHAVLAHYFTDMVKSATNGV